ncbi:MAG TPA: hypothetical protein DDW30_03660 [Clostridiales bacterium]|nr:hypothetical protein [Clostridiales bacterium]
MVNRIKRTARLCAGMLLAVLFLGILPIGSLTVGAEAAVLLGDGTYRIPIRYDIRMGADSFTSTATVEVLNGRYYLTVGYSSSIGYLRLNAGDAEVGKTTEQETPWTYETYTVSAETLRESLSFSAYINAMGRQTEFSGTLDLSAAEKLSDDVRDLGERPAEFVPVIVTDAAAEYTLRQGTVLRLPEATATLGAETCEVTVRVFCGETEQPITDGKLTPEQIGTYTVLYRAESERYRTSLGNNTFTEYRVTIHAVTGENETVRSEDPNGVLPTGTYLLAGRMTDTSAGYAAVAERMKTVADLFEVYTVELLDSEGEAVTAAGDFVLYFRADACFDRTKARVWRVEEDGSLTELECEGWGRYIKATTDRGGTYIVGVPGVAFRMPMWGYLLMLVGVLVVVLAVVFGIVRHARRSHRSRRKQSSGPR